MNVRISAMSALSTPPATPARSDLPRKVAILFLLIIDTAIGIYFLFNWKPALHPLLAHIFADLCLGLVAGIGARLLLRRRNVFVRFISAAAGLIVGLLLLGLLTRFRTGLGPLYFWRSTIDWSGLAQLSLGLVTLSLAMRAWSKPAQLVTAPAQVVPVMPARVPPEVHTRPRPKRKRAKRTQPAGSLHGSSESRSDVKGKPAVSRKRSPRIEKQPLVGLSLRKPKVRLSRVEKHLCPYCLEPVARNDPRGVVECEICHTLHHGDCWAIAGACQVPHYTA